MGDIYTPENFAVSRSVFRLISRIKTEAFAAMDEALASDPEISALEVTAAQYVIIVTLAEQEANSSAQLCKSFSYDPGAMTRMVDRLEAKGLVLRRRRTDDRRQIDLELTEAGKALYPKMKLLSMQSQNRFLRGFSKAEVRELEGYLSRILGNA
jgi:MarR family transcriptional regulator, multiple antibiotic resistance protein MarR